MIRMIERRVSSGTVEYREGDPGGNPPLITGYASVFNQFTTLYDGEDWWDPSVRIVLRERILPGAFDAALAEEQDVRALWNHDSSKVLGRTRSGTCQLMVDSTGLNYRIDPPDTGVGRDARVTIGRGDVSESSFAFRVRGNGEKFTTVEEEEKEEGSSFSWVYRVDRDILSVDLFDVSPVAYPAYGGTSVSSRSLEVSRDSRGDSLSELLQRISIERRAKRGRSRLELAERRLRLSGV